MLVLRHTLLACSILVVACGGGSEADRLIDRQAGAMNEMADILEGVSDEASLEKARPRMRALGQELAELKEEWEAYVAKAGAEDAAVKTYLATTPQEIAAAQARLTAAFRKMAMNPALLTHMTELTRELGAAFEAAQ